MTGTFPHVICRVARTDIDSNNPVIGRDNLVTSTNVTASSTAAGFPASNMGNPITSLKWKGSAAAAATVTVTLDGNAPNDYVAIVGHNFGSTGITVTAEVSIDGSTWTAVSPAMLYRDDGPKLLRFASADRTGIRLSLGAGSAAPELAVIYTGTATVVPARHWVGQQPMPLADELNIAAGESINGQFLGSIEVGGRWQTRVPLRLMSESFVRTDIRPLYASPRQPFFFAWRPGDWPEEVVFAQVQGNPKPVNELVNGLMAVDLDLTGIAI